MIDDDTDDEWCAATERSSGLMDTLLQETDITQDGDRIISFAPGEGMPVHYSTICKWNCEAKIEDSRSLSQTFLTN